MSAKNLRGGLLLMAASVLAACGGTAPAAATRVAYGSPAATVTPTPPAAPPAPSPSESPSVSTTVAPVPQAAAPAPVALAPMPVARPAVQTFALVPVGDTAGRGTVTVTTQSGRALISVFATGLPPGTVHSVHLHFGNCPSAGVHILVIGTLRADASGAGSVSDNVNSVFTGPGHFVIIYVGPVAGPLGACANLG